MLSHSESQVRLREYLHQQPAVRLGREMTDFIALRMTRYKGVDLGCGYYKLLNNEGLDSNPEAVKSVKSRYPGRKVLVGSIFNLPYADSSLASVSLSHVLEHLSPLSKALEEISRVLRPGGEIIFQLPAEGTLYMLGARFTTDRFVHREVVMEEPSGFRTSEHVNTCSGVLQELRKVFRVDRLVGIPFGFPLVSLNLWIVGRCIKE